MSAQLRPAWAEVDLEVVRHNATVLAEMFAPAELCAVVKADGYGHGAIPVARAALAGGAKRLAVALVEEGIELREAGIAAPILVLSQPPLAAMADVVAHDLTPTIYTAHGVTAASGAARERPLPVHVKVNTGMNRVGVGSDGALELVRSVTSAPQLALEGVFTHFAMADEPDDPFTDEQVRRFRTVLDQLQREGIEVPLVHCGNSAAGLSRADLRRSLVRSGIALYGVAPSAQVGLPPGIEPAMSVKSEVAYVHTVPAGEAVSYGQRYRVDRETRLAVVPVGYADGVPRQLSETGSVLIGGTKRPIAGMITMDQLMVDCGRDASVRESDPVVLLGSQGAERITAENWAQAAGTIGYDIVCRIGPRLPRRYL